MYTFFGTICFLALVFQKAQPDLNKNKKQNKKAVCQNYWGMQSQGAGPRDTKWKREVDKANTGSMIKLTTIKDNSLMPKPL